MHDDFDACYAAVQSRDARFDGWFVTAVRSTHIYCRPSCPARTPGRGGVRFYPTAAAAQLAGYRACKRCRPDASPGSPEWNLRADAVGRAMRLIADGVVDRDGVGGLARRLGYSERHLHRLLVAEVGAGPLALARAQRATTARVLIESTELPFSDVAFAAGFASIRMFNETVLRVFATTPTELRRRRHPAPAVAPGEICLRLPVRRPFAGGALLAHLASRVIPGVEEVDGGTYRRSLRLPHDVATVSATVAEDHVACTLRLGDLRDLTAAVGRLRRLFDLDADPHAVDDALGADPLLRPLVDACPGRRVPGAADAFEHAVRAVVGQQVSVRAACTVLGRMTGAAGTALTAPDGSVVHVFPTAAALAAADPATFPMPRARAAAVHGLATAVADGQVELQSGADRAEVERRLRSLPGIGPWTAGSVAMRALGDVDVFLPTDLGVRQAMERLGQPAAPAALAARAHRWRPWRSYAMQHLWATLDPAPRAAA